ncbi:alpha/beta hydrolase domain-containing protein 17C isoform X1 [Antechinus flavipes]|uniref:alpha/beta hydrolase domain-containing protein 17C isoform X1 n=1 Tax=Antechinus flavipes TaxID=38775 RepID=UPI0022362FDB|nr:alpha/beta hydrolase domain-containing protein 17C isoform X1 [Antechinus flavipes]
MYVYECEYVCVKGGVKTSRPWPLPPPPPALCAAAAAVAPTPAPGPEAPAPCVRRGAAAGDLPPAPRRGRSGRPGLSWRAGPASALLPRAPATPVLRPLPLRRAGWRAAVRPNARTRPQDERLFPRRVVLALLLPALPQPHRSQARLPAARAHLHRVGPGAARGAAPGSGFGAAAAAATAAAAAAAAAAARGGGGSSGGCRSARGVQPAPEREGGLAVLPARAGRRRGLLLSHSPRQPAGLHVRPLRSQQSLHAALLARQRRGPGPDVQLLHWPRLPHQLQHLLLRLLGLRRQLGQALGEEPLRGHRRRLAGPANPVWCKSREYYPLWSKYWNCPYSRLGISI